MIKIKVPYVYIPPCPRCDSPATGRYMKMPSVNRDYVMIDSLKRGEVIVFKPAEPIENAFCLDCGHEWAERIRTSWITRAEREEQCLLRGTAEMLAGYVEEKQIDLTHKHNPVRGIFGGLMDL